MLQPLDPNSTENSRHKFMVQSMFAPDEVTESNDTLVSTNFVSWVCSVHLMNVDQRQVAADPQTKQTHLGF